MLRNRLVKFFRPTVHGDIAVLQRLFEAVGEISSQVCSSALCPAVRFWSLFRQTYFHDSFVRRHQAKAPRICFRTLTGCHGAAAAERGLVKLQ